MSEEGVYVRKLGELIDELERNPREEAVHRDLCVFFYPYDQLWFAESHEYWWRDLDFERRSRVGRNPYLAGWHNVEIFGVPPDVRHEVYVRVSHWWSKGLEPSSLLNVPSPAVLSYFSSQILQGEGPVQPKFGGLNKASKSSQS